MIHSLATSKPRPLPCAIYRTAAGNEPVREWLKELPENERKQVDSDIKAVQFGWPLGLPLVDSLGDGLWEVRSRLPSRIARTIFFVQGENDHPSAQFHQENPSHTQPGTRHSQEEKT